MTLKFASLLERNEISKKIEKISNEPKWLCMV